MLRAFGVLVLAAAALAGGSPGPHTLRFARPADATLRAGPDVLTQEWQVLATDEPTRSSLLLTVDGIGSQSAAQLTYWPTVTQSGYSEIFHDLGPLGASPGFSVRGLSLTQAAGRWTLRLDQAVVQLQLSFTEPRPGPTATDWQVGEVTGPGTPHFLSTFDWSVPVATASVAGSIDYEGKHVDLAGWRGYVDHTWGRFDFGLGLMQHWDWAAVQGARGTWIVDGFETGAGITQWKPHDAQWRGVLVHVGPHRTAFCRARASRAGWRLYYAFGVGKYVYPQTLTASCAGMRATFTRMKNAYGYGTAVAETSARANGGGYGLFVEQNRVG